MAKFLPLVQMQRDLDKAIKEAQFAKYFEYTCQELRGGGTFDALWRAVQAEPGAQLLVSGPEDLPPAVANELPSFVRVAGPIGPVPRVMFFTPESVMKMVREAQQIAALAAQLLEHMKLKKLDQ